MWVTDHLEIIVLNVVSPVTTLARSSYLSAFDHFLWLPCVALGTTRRALKFWNVSGGTNLHFCGYHQYNNQNLRKYSSIHIESMSWMHMEAILNSFRDTCESYIMFLCGIKLFILLSARWLLVFFLSPEGDVSSPDFLCNYDL